MEHLQNIQDVFFDKILKVPDYQRGAMHNLKCQCPNWTEYIIRINNIVTFYGFRRGTLVPLGKDWKKFKYCPWCGRNLQEVHPSIMTA